MSKDRPSPRACLEMTHHEVQGEGRLGVGREEKAPTKEEFSQSRTLYAVIATS